MVRQLTLDLYNIDELLDDKEALNIIHLTFRHAIITNNVFTDSLTNVMEKMLNYMGFKNTRLLLSCGHMDGEGRLLPKFDVSGCYIYKKNEFEEIISEIESITNIDNNLKEVRKILNKLKNTRCFSFSHVNNELNIKRRKNTTEKIDKLIELLLKFLTESLTNHFIKAQDIESIIDFIKPTNLTFLKNGQVFYAPNI